jgi:Taurine catabolism dioxygenase TauD, TfdA family
VLYQKLDTQGWSCLRVGARLSIEESCLEIARTLGQPVGTRSSRNLVDFLRPLNVNLANPVSLSSKTGTHIQPWHVDLAHKAKPARFIVLGCLSVGSNQVCTELVDRRIFLSDQHKAAARAEPFLISNGCHSFYGCILEGNEKYLRFDPGCMNGATKEAKNLMDHLLDLHPNPSYRHYWNIGDILIIDNWRMLHHRTDASSSLDRNILRVTVLEGY